MNLDTLSALDAPIDEDLSPIEGIDINESPDAEPTEPTKPEQPQFDPSVLENNISDKVINKLMSLANTAQPANTMQVSPLQQEIHKLKEQGVPQEAIDNFLQLQAAAHHELSSRQQAQAQQIFVANYREGLRDLAGEALQEVAAAIKPIANNSGLRGDLVDRMGLVVMQTAEFQDIRNAIDSFKPPSKNRLKEVAAKVADQWCTENGLTNTKSGLDLKSSKPQPNDATFDVNKLSKPAAMIYNITLKATNDPKKARRRAMSV
jgi:hypothetical protein